MTDFAYPPIPAGEKILVSQAQGILYPKTDFGSDVQYWLFSLMREKDIDPNSTLQASFGDIQFHSKFSKITDPKSGKESFVFVDDTKITIIADVDGRVELKTKKRTDPFIGKNAFFTICPATHSEMIPPPNSTLNGPDIVTPIVKSRSFFSAFTCDPQIDDAQADNVILYDLLDDTLAVSLPFKAPKKNTLEVSHIARVVSYKETYVVFVVSHIDPSEVCNVNVYAIKEADLITKQQSLKMDDFIQYAFDVEGYPVDIYVDHFYYDSENTGSSQIVLCLNNLQGESLSLYMLEITDELAFKLTTSYKTNYPSSMLHLLPMRERTGLSSYVMSEYGPVFFLNNVTIGRYDQEVHGKKLTENASVVNLELIRFDPENKKFLKPSRAKTQAHQAVQLVGENQSDFVGGLPWVTHVKVVPNVAIVKNDKGSLSISFKSVSVRYRYILIETDGLYQTANAVTGNDPRLPSINGTRAALNSINFDILENLDTGEISFDTAPYDLLPNSVTISEITNKSLVIPTGTPISQLNVNRGPLITHEADLTGDSIILGEPTLTFGSDLMQVTGFYRALPFQDAFKRSSPIISVSSSQGTIKGVVDSVTSSWQAGYNAAGSGTVEGITASAHFGQNFGGHDMTMKSDTTGITLHAMEDLSSYDLLTGYAADFYVWEYPLYRHTTDSAPFDTLSILVPMGYSSQDLDAKEADLEYIQDYEIGSILTYIGSNLPGYDEKTLLFRPTTITATDDTQGGMTITYDENNSTSKEKTRSTDTSMNAGGSLGFGGILTLSGHYTKSTIKNHSTHTTQTKDYALTFHSGTVSDAQYEYKFTPLVYRHKDTHVIIVTCLIELNGLGMGWKRYFSNYDVRLMRTFPYTTDKSLHAFSRSIQFQKQSDGSVDIDLNVFNNSLYPAESITCDIYEGLANFYVTPIDVSKLKKLGTLMIDKLEVVERKKVTLAKQKLPEKCHITVAITVNNMKDLQKFFWGAYPYNYGNQTIRELQAQVSAE